MTMTMIIIITVIIIIINFSSIFPKNKITVYLALSLSHSGTGIEQSSL